MTRLRIRPDVTYHALHVAILDGWVYDYDKRGLKRGAFGSIAGARISCKRLEPTVRKRTGGQRAVDTFNASLLLGPLGLLAGISRKEDRGQITIVFTNGNVLTRIRIGPLWRQALRDAKRFNDRSQQRNPVS
jgi:hypothetical protein